MKKIKQIKHALGLSPNGKRIDVDELFQLGLITYKERKEAISKYKEYLKLKYKSLDK
jgi:hypothetical protein